MCSARIGLMFLIYTVITTIQKVETSFNFVWRVERPRSFARRFTEYLSVMIVGTHPARRRARASGLGRCTVPSRSGSTRCVRSPGVLARARAHSCPMSSSPSVFTFMYLFIPNTRVRAARRADRRRDRGHHLGAGGQGIHRGPLYSSQLVAVYTGFAIVLTTLIWVYLSWLILLHRRAARLLRAVSPVPAARARIGGARAAARANSSGLSDHVSDRPRLPQRPDRTGARRASPPSSTSPGARSRRVLAAPGARRLCWSRPRRSNSCRAAIRDSIMLADIIECAARAATRPLDAVDAARWRPRRRCIARIEAAVRARARRALARGFDRRGRSTGSAPIRRRAPCALIRRRWSSR